tara:strand:+ start:895 stop:1800 length:906 start_codon:yes stop_codon:yes gene_type:complete
LRVSYIIPTYNRAHLVLKTIKSIEKQPYKLKEIIVVDDASTDNLQEVIKQQNCDYLKYIKCDKNRGQNHARNLGIKQSSSDIVTIMDSDDQDYGNDLTPIVEFFKNNESISSVFTPVISQKNRKILSNIKKCYSPMGFKELLNGTCSGEYQPFFRANKLPEMFFHENLNIKRSCTFLSYFDFYQKEKFTILPLVTKLYNDIHNERLGNIHKINEDANELIECYSLILKNFGKDIYKTNKHYFNNLIIKISYYILISNGRLESLKNLKKLKVNFSLFKILPLIIIFIFLGGKNTIRLRAFLK